MRKGKYIRAGKNGFSVRASFSAAGFSVAVDFLAAVNFSAAANFFWSKLKISLVCGLVWEVRGVSSVQLQDGCKRREAGRSS
jgi:hypothetical protein